MTGFSRPWSRVGRVVVPTAAAALLAISAVAPVAAGGSFSPPITLRTVDKGVAAGDIATRGDWVAVAWSEYVLLEPAGGMVEDRVLVRISADGGASFAPRQRVDMRPNAWPAIDICHGSLVIVSEVHPGTGAEDEWDIVLHRRALEGTDAAEVPITDPLADLRVTSPDVACVGDRFVAVTWAQRLAGGTWRARLRLLDPFPGTAGGPSPVTIDLGPAHARAEVSVAATADTIVAAWRQGSTLRFKRFDVLPGSVGASLAVARTLLPSGADGPVEIGLSGDRIIVAAMRARDLVVRRSTDNGVSFGARRTLLEGDDHGGFIAVPVTIDVRGPGCCWRRPGSMPTSMAGSSASAAC